MRFSVVIPSYRRPEVLKTCLMALSRQTRLPDEVLIVRRSNDDLTADLMNSEIGKLVPLREVPIGPNDHFGIALNAGIMASTGDYVALTDDDAEPPVDWIEQIISKFDDPQIAGVGGRDVQANAVGTAEEVGIVKWHGLVVGNHHIGVGSARDVDVLKGVNCCFRGEPIRAIGVDPRLKGSGTVVHTELSMCLPLRRAKYRLVYDPKIALLHHIAPRQDGDHNNRGGFNGTALRDAVHNETVILWEYLNWPRRMIFLTFGLLVGTRRSPGVMQIPRSAVRYKSVRNALERWLCTLKGRYGGLCTLYSEALNFRYGQSKNVLTLAPKKNLCAVPQRIKD